MLQILLTVALLHWMVLIVPGPNVLIVCSLAANGDRKAALSAGLGITLVAVAWASLAALGLGAVFAVHAGARTLAQLAGGAYLIYVAARMARTRAVPTGARSPYTAAQAFRLGVMTNLLNPKSTLFFASVFAAALPPEPSLAMGAIVVLIVAVDAFAWHTALALLFSGDLAKKLYSHRRRLMDQVVAFLLSALGLKLIASTVVDAMQSDS
jgi:threonine/homoserine/homoserine lactone efflux protein